MRYHSLPRSGILIALAVLACGDEDSVPARAADGAINAERVTEVPTCAELAGAHDDPAPALRVETVAEGLVVPWAMDFAPDGRIFVTERPGRIRISRDGELQAEPWAELDVFAEGEAGLLGIALAPDFEGSGHVYVSGTFVSDSGNDLDIPPRGNPAFRQASRRQSVNIELRVYRLTDRDGRGTSPTRIAGGIPAARLHTGSALAFGPDGALYVTAGDALQPALSQDTASLAGKVLRYLPDGEIPGDNPLERSPVFALGLRNVQGLDWHPETGDLFVTSHGPSGLRTEGERTGDDELNRIAPRGNYGWPEVSGLSDDPRFIPPLAEWTPAIAPAGLAVYTGSELPWFGNIFIGALRGEHLRRVVVEEDREVDSGWRLVCEEALFESDFGRIRSVGVGADGSLYFTTSNRDGRGHPDERDDRLLRVVPERAP